MSKMEHIYGCSLYTHIHTHTQSEVSRVGEKMNYDMIFYTKPHYDSLQ